MIRITDEIIDPGAVLDSVGSDADGAKILFLGTVRDHNDGRAVEGLRYEAYPAMAEAVLKEIVQEAIARYETDQVAVVHRTGTLGLGEVAVAVAVASHHRAEAFDAARYVMEELKQRLPVWKEEQYVDGQVGWVKGEVPQP